MLLTMIAGEVGKESGDDLISRAAGQRGDEGFCRRDDPDCSAPMRDTRLHRLSGGEVHYARNYDVLLHVFVQIRHSTAIMW